MNFSGSKMFPSNRIRFAILQESFFYKCMQNRSKVLDCLCMIHDFTFLLHGDVTKSIRDLTMFTLNEEKKSFFRY